MSKEQFVYSSKNSFSSGELTPTMEGRNDLPIYQHGVKKLMNFMILPSGGIIRRHGTQYAYVFEDKIPTAKRMINIMHSREWSFLIIFSSAADKTRIEVLINGKGKPIDLGTIDVVLDINQFSFTAYQGVAYVSFGIKYSVWRFLIDPGKIIEFDLLNLDELNEMHRAQLFVFDVFKVKGKVYRTDRNQREIIGAILPLPQNEVNNALTNAAKDDLKELTTNSLSVFEGRLWALGTGKNIHEIWASSMGAMDEFNLAYASLLEARNPMSAFATTFVSSTFDNILW